MIAPSANRTQYKTEVVGIERKTTGVQKKHAQID